MLPQLTQAAKLTNEFMAGNLINLTRELIRQNIPAGYSRPTELALELMKSPAYSEVLILLLTDKLADEEPDDNSVE